MIVNRNLFPFSSLKYFSFSVQKHQQSISVIHIHNHYLVFYGLCSFLVFLCHLYLSNRNFLKVMLCYIKSYITPKLSQFWISCLLKSVKNKCILILKTYLNYGRVNSNDVSNCKPIAHWDNINKLLSISINMPTFYFLLC